jgi:hypothetical protein
VGKIGIRSSGPLGPVLSAAKTCAVEATAGRRVGPGSGPYEICLSRNQARALFTTETVQKAELEETKLGCGSWACVWDRGDGKVAKITRDPDDVAAFALAKGLPGVVKVHEAYELIDSGKDIRSGESVPIYGLVAQKLDPLPPEQVDWIANRFCRARISMLLSLLHYKTSGAPRKKFKVSPITRAKLVKACMTVPDDQRAACRRHSKEMVSIFERLYRRGVDWIDVNENNIGVDARGRWVALDLGMSDAPLKKKPPALHGTSCTRLK